jgi:hypothetical protein
MTIFRQLDLETAEQRGTHWEAGRFAIFSFRSARKSCGLWAFSPIKRAGI